MIEITLCPDDIYTGSLILINREHPFYDWRNKPSLIPAHMNYPEVLMEMKAASILSNLMKDLGCENDIIPVSGYRSLKEQSKIYQEAFEEHGREFAEKYVALPNHSEHQTGLAVDLAKRQRDIDFIRPEFPYEGIYNEFRKKAPDYGFIQRYQRGKEEITGIAHEPWHFRYVGYPHSKIMEEKGLSLEEYVDYLRGFPFDEKPLIMTRRKHTTEIFYVRLAGLIRKEISLPEHTLFQTSGNNVDGMIVTIWRKAYE